MTGDGKPPRTPWRDMTASARVAYVVGALIAAVLVVGVLAIAAGLLWRGIRAVWGLGA